MAKFLLVVFALVAATLAVPHTRIDPTANWRIVGGKPASDGQFPYIVSLRSSGRHFCGGSIINKNTILTAAHCIDGSSATSITVVTGTTTLNSGGDSYSVKSGAVHPNWDSWNIKNDIAILKLKDDISFNDLVSAIDLETDEVSAGSDAVLCGWGTTSYPGSAPNNLQFLPLKVIGFEDCKKRHGSNTVYDSQVCTLTQRGEGACHGDSGGPLASNGKQIGIVSWGRPCAIGYPDVFTRVAAFSDFIKQYSRY